MLVMDNELKLTVDQKVFLQSFFAITDDFIQNNDMLDPENIDRLAKLYAAYLESEGKSEDKTLSLFLMDLKLSQTYCRENACSIEFKIAQMAKPVVKNNRCQNRIINKWRQESAVLEYLSAADFVDLDKRMELKITQNKVERRLSWEEAKDKVVK